MDESSEREVTVDRVIYRDADGGFTVLRVTPADGSAPFVAAGVVAHDVAPGDPLAVSGSFETHPRFGHRLRLASCRPRPPTTREGVLRYLSSGRVRGIGPKLAQRLVDAFGDRALEVLEREPGRVLAVPGVGRRKMEELARALGEGRAQRETLVFLQGLGLGPGLAHAVWKELGTGAVARVRADPYELCRVVARLGFRTADRLARAQGVAPDAPSRLVAGLRHVLREAMDQGHVCLPSVELVARAARLLGVPPDAVTAALEDARRAREVVLLSPDREPAEAARAYLPVLAAAEGEAADRLLALAARPRPPAPPVSEDAGRVPATLTDEQRAAIALLLRERVALLTGGPGVGKTTVLRAVVAAYGDAGFRVALASPTGRAARRLGQATGLEASTLHRLFGLVPGVAGARLHGPLDADVLIVDEASMIDLPLLVRVLRGLDPRTILILVGDPHQLPSVGPGSVLGDLIACGRFPVARLETIFRQDRRGRIVENAHRILRGRMPLVPDDGGASDFFFTRRPDGPSGAELVRRLVLERIPERFGLRPDTDIQVLSPMRRGPTGVDALNALLQEALNGTMPGLVAGARTFREGDRVMQVRNDYDNDLMNGDLGRVSAVDPRRGVLRARFDGRDVELSGPELDDLELAFATTVHKAQGGEFPAVVLALFPDHAPMLRRNVLYTAVTRARRLMVIVGTEPALRSAVTDDRLLRRHGALEERLRGLDLVPAGPVGH